MKKQTRYTITPTLKKWQTAIEPIDESITWWNLDMIRAGSALWGMGYSPEQIGFICMEVQDSGGLLQVEKDWLKFFSANETFCIKQRKEPVRRTSTGDITFEPKGLDVYEQSFKKRGDRFVVKVMPPRSAT